ncbi:MAG: hypothetical protein LQ350_005156 [Teloschistes chrysophthalmus]|nr:MAG: hypothetical protein LQ350_005156 [Niorma chrysophthalma]
MPDFFKNDPVLKYLRLWCKIVLRFSLLAVTLSALGFTIAHLHHQTTTPQPRLPSSASSDEPDDPIADPKGVRDRTAPDFKGLLATLLKGWIRNKKSRPRSARSIPRPHPALPGVPKLEDLDANLPPSSSTVGISNPTTSSSPPRQPQGRLEVPPVSSTGTRFERSPPFRPRAHATDRA